MSKPRLAAASVVHAVCEQAESLDIALAHHGSSLTASEFGLYQEIAYGGVRWYLAYLGYLNTQLKKPFRAKDSILNALLVTALYQLDYTAQAPHAIVNETVSLTSAVKRKWAKGVVNAVLRAYMRQRDKSPLIKQPSWHLQSFPPWLSRQIKLDWPDQLEQIIQASQCKPPLTLRVNLQQQSTIAALKLLEAADIQANPCIDSPIGITLAKPLSVNKIPGFEAGHLSVQDEAAQLSVPLMDLAPGQRVLDACAAPGGKSLHILEAEPALGELITLDFSARLPRLRENLSRAGVQATIIEGDLLAADAWWDGKLFDRILVDAPCTGTGVIRRHPDIKFRRKPEDVQQFSATQKDLLTHAYKMLKPDGKMLYTTCSILSAENEQCVSDFIKQTHGVHSLTLPQRIGIKTAHGCQRLPGIHPGDGFFYALLQKLDD